MVFGLKIEYWNVYSVFVFVSIDDCHNGLFSNIGALTFASIMLNISFNLFGSSNSSGLNALANKNQVIFFGHQKLDNMDSGKSKSNRGADKSKIICVRCLCFICLFHFVNCDFIFIIIFDASLFLKCNQFFCALFLLLESSSMDDKPKREKKTYPPHTMERRSKSNPVQSASGDKKSASKNDK